MNEGRRGADAATLAQELQERGFVNQCSAETLEEVVESTTRTVYLGIDPTADAMHVGHLVPYMLLNHLMRYGHTAILLMGGGTALIGDPSGKDTEREFVEAEVVQTRCARLEAQVRKLTPVAEVRFVNNYDWLSKLSMVEFLRDVGKHFTVNAMVKKDSVATRLASEQGISYTEFSYALLQSYDYYHLHQTYGCDLQIGASDQWGNITSGIDYVRRVTGDTVYGLTMPLLINPATGKKFGKSEGNSVWLDPEKTSPFAFYQFWLNTPDDQVVPYLKLFTLLSLTEIAEIEAAGNVTPAERIAQKRLAHEVTAFVHGADVADAVANASAVLFGTEAITKLTPEEQDILRKNAPYVEVAIGTPLVDVLVAAGLAGSKREARTFLESGAVSIDGVKIVELDAVLAPAAAPLALLRRGKKQVCVIESAS